ncbi:MAG: L,D-transpeptidase [Actinobacteria bacterium]|nr:L,D-transpeptidase [Actinomycetota bacterium]
MTIPRRIISVCAAVGAVASPLAAAQPSAKPVQQALAPTSLTSTTVPKPSRAVDRCNSSDERLPGAPVAGVSWSARFVTLTGLRTRPTYRVVPFARLSPVAPLGGGTTTLLVTGRSCDLHERLWLRVFLPQRPNGTQAWILRDVVVVRRVRFRIEIDQSARRLTLFRSNRRFMTIPVAVGKPMTPTPNGRFALAEEIATNDPGGFLGPIVLPITGFSNKLNEYKGGNGRVALHGTSLPGLIGRRASNGCVRMRNADVVRLARYASPGIPVWIHE